VDDAIDDWVLILFLLGRADLEDEFSRYEGVADTEVDGACGMRLTPRRASDVETVLLEVDPETFDIRRLRMESIDGSASDFRFDGVETNGGLDEELFDFTAPPGVRVVEGF